MVASIACNFTYAIEAPNEPMLLGDFVRIASHKMKVNIVLAPGLEEEQTHIYGASRYSIENLFNAVLASNNLQIRRVDGVHVLEKRGYYEANYELHRFNLERPMPEFAGRLDDYFSYFEKSVGFKCHFSQESETMIFANCPKKVIPLVKMYIDITVKPVKRVVIKAHVVETTNSDFYQVGFKYGLTTDNGGMTYKINDSLLSQAMESLDLNLSFDKFTSLISVLETDSSVKTVSKPRILVDDNESSKFEAVQNIPIVSLVDEGDSTDSRTRTRIEYQPVGVVMEVRPVVLSSGRIKVYFSSNYSDVESFGSSQNPVFNTKSIDTNVTIDPGEVISLGGLISHNEDEQLGGVPLLKDLPKIGSIFSTTHRSMIKRELNIMLTVSVED